MDGEEGVWGFHCSGLRRGSRGFHCSGLRGGGLGVPLEVTVD